jgi:AcrR family transcriptional regulator
MTGGKSIQKRNPLQSKERILQAAIDVFARRGPLAATVEEICALARLNKRMVYHYFGSKEILYRESLRVVYAQFFSLEVELGSMLLPPEQLLEMLIRRYYQFLKEHPSFVRLISHENLNEGHAARSLGLEGQKAPVITALTLAMQRGSAEKRFREGIDVAQLLVSIFALCFFYFANRHTMELFLGKGCMDPAHLEGRVRHVVDLVLRGIRLTNDE